MIDALDPAAFTTEYVPIDSVKPFPGNPRRGDVDGIALSITEFGQYKPILVQASTDLIIAGNQTWHALKKLGRDHVSIIRLPVDDLRAQQILAADNRWSERGSNDEDALGAFLKSIVDQGGFTEAMGYASEDVDRLLASIAAGPQDADTLPDVPALADVWVKPGEMYALGTHRILCGDATDPAAYARLLGDRRVDLLWTDPPYGVAYQTKLSTEEAVARNRRRDGLEVSGDTEDVKALKKLLDAAFGNAREVMKPGAAYYISAPEGVSASGDVHIVFRQALADAGLPIHETLVWVKDVFVMGRQDYHWRHEPMLYGWKPGAAHFFVRDRTLDTVWEIPRPKKSEDHPTQKPVELVERAILASSKRRAVVLDPFSGSGTTIIAAERNDRHGFGIELDPRYVQVIVERWQGITGGRAELLP